MSYSNERSPQRLTRISSKTKQGDPQRGVKYVDSRKFFLQDFIESEASLNATFMMVVCKPSWLAAKHILEFVEEDCNQWWSKDISKDRHMVSIVYNAMRAREALAQA